MPSEKKNKINSRPMKKKDYSKSVCYMATDRDRSVHVFRVVPRRKVFQWLADERLGRPETVLWKSLWYKHRPRWTDLPVKITTDFTTDPWTDTFHQMTQEEYEKEVREWYDIPANDRDYNGI